MDLQSMLVAVGSAYMACENEERRELLTAIWVALQALVEHDAAEAAKADLDAA